MLGKPSFWMRAFVPDLSSIDRDDEVTFATRDFVNGGGRVDLFNCGSQTGCLR